MAAIRRGRVASIRDVATGDVLLPPVLWNVLAGGGWLVAIGGLLARPHYTAVVRIPPGRAITAANALVVIGGVTLVVALVGRRREAVGLAGLALVSLGLAAAWMMLGDHKFAGPVVLSMSSSHGVHLGDPLVLVPLGSALLMTIRAASLVRASRRHAAPDQRRRFAPDTNTRW